MLSILDACWLASPPSRSHARRRVFWAPRVSLSSPDAREAVTETEARYLCEVIPGGKPCRLMLA